MIAKQTNATTSESSPTTAKGILYFLLPMLLIVGSLIAYKSSAALTVIGKVSTTGIYKPRSNVIPGVGASEACVSARMLNYFLVIWPALLFGILISAAVSTFVSPQWLERLLGRRSLFLAGVGLFAAASLFNGLATSETQLIIGRAIQGLGGAMLSPAALSVITTSFSEGAERTKALAEHARELATFDESRRAPLAVTISLLCDGMPNGGVYRASDVSALLEQSRSELDDGAAGDDQSAADERGQRRRFTEPSDVRTIPRGRIEVVELDDTVVGRMTYEPGWRWSVDVQPIAGTDTCQFHHLGVTLAGRLRAQMPDGTELEIGPGEVFEIPPGHDAWVVGDEPWVGVDFEAMRTYGKQRDAARDERILGSIVFTDIVDSTQRAALSLAPPAGVTSSESTIARPRRRLIASRDDSSRPPETACSPNSTGPSAQFGGRLPSATRPRALAWRSAPASIPERSRRSRATSGESRSTRPLG